jgi:gamma-glutamylputrescine oxidase
VVHTRQGQVQAKFVVACGNAYLGETVPELATKVLPASSQVITTEVLGEELASSLLPRDHCVEDMNYFLDYYRITGDRRLLFGGGTVYGGKDPSDIVAEIHPHLLKTFPQLEGKRIEFAWSGNIALTVSRVPHMGRLGDNLYFSHGYSGHGVTGSHLAGRLLAEAIGGQAEGLDRFAKLTHLPFPGGKLLRVPLVRMGAWYFRAKERLGL